MKQFLAMFAAVLAVASVLVGVSLVQSSSDDPAAALSGSSFDAGNVISDANFYDGDALSTAAIQSFLTAQGGTCRSGSCLANGRFSMNARGADAMCSAVAGGSSLSTAQIIAQVAIACGISPKVMLVTLQKEQGLVTATNPSAATLQKAMGYACPDTGNGCDPAYAGVGNQMYWSAWQWKRYGNPAGTSAYFTWFNPGTHQIQYNVPTSCGTKTVAVANNATAALYYYTPYTPNTAALNNLYGSGDSCSAYGNRNFWRLYSDWFGDPTGAGTPIGNLDALSAGIESVSVRGWAMDAALDTPTEVDVYIDGRGYSMIADGARPDVAAAYPGRGAAHGFSESIGTTAGKHTVCVYALGVDTSKNRVLGCTDVTVTSASPVGSVDAVQAAPGGIAVRGWALDPEASASVKVAVYVDGAHSSFLADGARPDVARAYPANGAAHGFARTVAATPGVHTVCIYGINAGAAGSNALIGRCATVSVPVAGGFGALDTVVGTLSASGPTITVSGWAIDGSSTGSTPVDVYIDGRGTRLSAEIVRSDVGRSWPGYGAAHGFTRTIAVSAGTHSVCAYAIGARGNNLLRCATVTVTNAAPIGSLDSVAGITDGVAVRGWAIDPDTSAPTQVHVYVDGRGTALRADQRRPDVGSAHPASGALHGFAATVPAAAGPHSVCVYAIDTSAGDNPTLGCRSIVVP